MSDVPSRRGCFLNDPPPPAKQPWQEDTAISSGFPPSDLKACVQLMMTHTRAWARPSYLETQPYIWGVQGGAGSLCRYATPSAFRSHSSVQSGNSFGPLRRFHDA